MKVASLLLIWSLPILQAGAHDHALHHDHDRADHAPRAGTRRAPRVMEGSRDASLPDAPRGGSPGLYVEDEEDPVEDGAFVDGFGLYRPWEDLGRGDISSLAQVQQDLPRIPPHPQPLRC